MLRKITVVLILALSLANLGCSSDVPDGGAPPGGYSAEEMKAKAPPETKTKSPRARQ